MRTTVRTYLNSQSTVCKILSDIIFNFFGPNSFVPFSEEPFDAFSPCFGRIGAYVAPAPQRDGGSVAQCAVLIIQWSEGCRAWRQNTDSECYFIWYGVIVLYWYFRGNYDKEARREEGKEGGLKYRSIECSLSLGCVCVLICVCAWVESRSRSLSSVPSGMLTMRVDDCCSIRCGNQII